jgi:hypothetical protein
VNRRQILLLSASAAAAGVLLAYLGAHTGLDLAGVERLILGLHSDALAEITVLLGFNTYLAGEKWRLLDQQLGPGGYGVMPRTAYFAWTAVGVGLGQILPTQLSLALCRSLGSHLHQRSGLMRGAGLTIFEQLFDIAAAGLLGLASVAVLLAGGGGLVWMICALVACAAGFALCQASIWLAAHASSCAGVGAAQKSAGLRRLLIAWSPSPLVAPGIGRRLFALSLLRFATLVLVAAASASAVPLEIPIWRLAAALPFAVVGNALAVTPGGLGVNEWAASSALFAFGTPFGIAAQWALANRALVAVAAFAGAVVGSLVLVGARRPRSSHVT